MEFTEYHCPRCDKTLEREGEGLLCKFCGLNFDETRAGEFEREREYAEDDLAWNEYNSAGLLSGAVYFACDKCETNYAVPIEDGMPDAQSADVCCPLCGGMLSSVATTAPVPDLLLPFNCDRKAAEDAFSRFCKFKPLLPSKFTPHKNIKLLKKLYLPYWTAACTAQYKTRYDAVKRKKQRTDSEKSIQTDGFMALREGTAAYSGLLSSALSTAEDILTRDFSLEEGKPFDKMPDAIVAVPDIPAKQAQKELSELVGASMDKLLKGTVKGYSKKKRAAGRLCISDTHTNLALVPLWIISAEYKGRIYRFVMNAQNGKVSGELPYSKLKIASVFAICTAAISVVGTVLTLLL